MYNHDKKSLFNGYVREPLPMIILASVVAIGFLAFALWGTYEVLADTNQTTSTTIITSIETYHEDGPLIVLTASNNQRFNILKETVEKETLMALISDETILRLTYDLETIHREIGADVLAIDDAANQKIITYEEIQQVQKKQELSNCIFLWGSFLLYVIFISVCYYIISHAEKFPRLAALLVRRNFRNF